ncbi:survival motor neuron protein [Anastrepha obliqua]|uniref:survival motor neuron protein n=1 Tax=Anastrepha obliqua TaxID=95512 RepID=UPI00240A39A6|nr:survival motor neuron protein [Anastrepha obliqua]
MELTAKSFGKSLPTDVWDEKILIKSYNECVKVTNEDIAKNIARNTNIKIMGDFNEAVGISVGDYVRAIYENDGCDYEAKIISVNKASGTCVVKYIGYDNEQTVNLKDLVPTWGKKARRLQFEQAINSTNNYHSDKRPDIGHSKENSFIKVPPPPPVPPMLTQNVSGSEHLSAMLMSWYMSGYYTGIYEGIQIRNSKRNSKT